MAGGPRARLISISDLDRDAIARWRDLGERAVEPNPFFGPDFLIPAAELVERAPQRLLVVDDDGAWRACMPLGRRRLRLLTGTREAGVTQYGFLSTPLLAADAPERAADDLLASLVDPGGTEVLLLERLATDGPFFDALRRAVAAGRLRLLESHEYERGLLARRDGGVDAADLGRHHRREARRMGRRLSETFGGTLEVTDRAGDPGAVERFLELELSGWKGRTGTAMGSTPGHAEFFRRLCAAFAAAGRLELLDLGTGARSAAMKCNLIAPPGSFAFKIAFDDAVGQVLARDPARAREIERFEAGELEWMDSCADPDNAMINRLWPGRRAVGTFVVGASTWRGRLARGSLGFTRGLKPLKRVAERLPRG